MIRQYLNKHFIDNISVKNKLVLIFILCAVIPILVTNIIFLSITNANVRQQQLNQFDSSLSRTKLQLYKNINDTTLGAYSILTDKEINDALEDKYHSVPEFSDAYNSFLRTNLEKIIYIVNQVGEVNIYTNNKSIPESSGYKQITAEVKKQDWYKSSIANSHKFYISAYKNDGKLYFSLVKVLNYFMLRQHYTKILKIDFRDTEIIKTLNSEKIGGHVYMVNDRNRIVYSTNQKYINSGKILSKLDLTNTHKGYYISSTKLNKYSELKDWKLVLVVKEKDISSIMNNSKSFIICMCIANIIFAYLIIQVISSSFKVRLGILNKHIKKMGKQNFEVIKCNEGKDEIGTVIREFNRMTTKIHELIRNVYEVNLQKKNLEIEQRQAQINALQSQINPHFLFNVLESIRMRSVIKKETETAQIIKYVSKMFRRLLQWRNDMITVKEEMDYIEDFLKVEKYRFGDKFEYEITMDDRTNDFKIPKMIFQPLVENACVHGIEGSKNGGKVIIEVKSSINWLECYIIDNGIGIAADKLRQIMDNLEGGGLNNSGKSVGIRNVYNRLRLIYGEKFNFEISSKYGLETVICIKIPEQS
ncbi:sensor histidine kinase [Clostridium oryzae]|uniref:Sensor histidine kinase YpdA n=1 Tax=Clostridium oryzae TaxID=1450648 RepID=A0A1V4I9J2_9CLOT|nr:histidine kinase [Clostridium oryzae]OPJ56609.1 sensor histidine kinase YpdA [Clostridium oryzae]